MEHTKQTPRLQVSRPAWIGLLAALIASYGLGLMIYALGYLTSAGTKYTDGILTILSAVHVAAYVLTAVLAWVTRRKAALNGLTAYFFVMLAGAILAGIGALNMSWMWVCVIGMVLCLPALVLLDIAPWMVAVLAAAGVVTLAIAWREDS